MLIVSSTRSIRFQQLRAMTALGRRDFQYAPVSRPRREAHASWPGRGTARRAIFRSKRVILVRRSQNDQTSKIISAAARSPGPHCRQSGCHGFCRDAVVLVQLEILLYRCCCRPFPQPRALCCMLPLGALQCGVRISYCAKTIGDLETPATTETPSKVHGERARRSYAGPGGSCEGPS